MVFSLTARLKFGMIAQSEPNYEESVVGGLGHIRPRASQVLVRRLKSWYDLPRYAPKSEGGGGSILFSRDHGKS